MPTSSSRPSMPTGDSLNLKLFTAPVTSPFSTRYTPSLVSPVRSRVCGSTSRMYHRQVSSSPRRVEAIICSSVGASAADVARRRLLTAGVTGTPATAAEYRDEISAASEPSRIQSVALSGSPLSNTEESGPDACAMTNGAHCSPPARGALLAPSLPGGPIPPDPPRGSTTPPNPAGSLDSVTGWLDSRSPSRVPPPGLLNTVRPSAASLAPDDQYM